MVGAAMVGVAVPVGASSRGLNRPRLLRLIGTAAEIHLRLAGGSRRASGGDWAQETRVLESTAAEDVSSGLNQPETEESLAKENKALVALVVKKRKLYRQLSGTEVPWFPHDNDMDLLKELCWESGRPRRVIHGTPAGGAGVQGCLEVGCSVVLLCFDDHHRTNIWRFLLERAVEAMVSGSTLVFKDESLRARSIELSLTKDDAKDKKDGKEEGGKKNRKDKKDEKDTKNKKEKLKKDTKNNKDKQKQRTRRRRR